MTGYDKIDHASLTDVGIRRSHNQDSHAILLAADEEEWQKRGHVFLVADGMGAHAVGELASEMAAGIIPHAYQKYVEEGTGPALRKAFIEANTSIHTRGQKNREFEGMGTTCCALLIRADGAWIGHVGDSRVYRIRDGQIEQLTYDHSLAWEMARRKKVKPDSLEGIPSNVLVRSLGPESMAKVDVEGPHPLREGDIFLLCSDGLSGPLKDPEIGAVASVLPPAEACQVLIDLTNLRGGPDNITTLIIRIGAIPPSPATQTGAAPRKPWYRRIDWALLVVTLAVVLAGGAVALSVLQVPERGPVFLLAGGSLIMGMLGLLIHLRREQGRLFEADHRPRLKVYRQTSCRIEKPLLDEFVELEKALAQQIREKHFEIDWPTFEHHHQLAEAHRNQGELEAAYREYCRAMLPLTRALNRLSHKGEKFQPNWERKTRPVKVEGGTPKIKEGQG